MKKTLKFYTMAIATIMTIGSVTFFSCDKEDDTVKAENISLTRVASSEDMKQANLIDILTVKRGKKTGEIFQKYCTGNKGLYWLWFGGTFLTDEYNIDRVFPPCFAGGSDNSYFVSNKAAGAYAQLYGIDSLNIVLDYSCVDENEMKYWVDDAEKGEITINDSITFSDKQLLSSWGYDNIVVIPSATYPIKKVRDSVAQFLVRVPIIEITK